MLHLHEIEEDLALPTNWESSLILTRDGDWSVGLVSHSFRHGTRDLIDTFNRGQSRFRFGADDTDNGLRMTIHDRPTSTLFDISRSNGVSVSTSEAEGICRYARINVKDYLMVCSMLGLMQSLCIEYFDHLIIEDFIHPDIPGCLLPPIESKPMAALLFENPKLCSGCLNFYMYLGLEPEIIELIDVLKRVGPLYQTGMGTASQDDLAPIRI